uniref:Zinc finger, CCHC-type n=1 Tax=Tanacetum cinerariifolium TaxID=118510 RepID=A0A699IVL0_TANCI|nr:zinc finger, CCHC-type [Tanacetum cinerariifolium]
MQLKTLVIQWSLKRSLKRDEVSDQYSYCFNVEDDPKKFDKAIKTQYVAFWKKEINDEMDSIMGNNTWVLTDPTPGCKPLGCKWIFKRKLKGFKQKLGIEYFDTYALVARINTIRLLIAMVDPTKEFLSSRIFMKDMGEDDVIIVSTLMDTIKKLMPNNGQAVSQLEYSRVISCLMYSALASNSAGIEVLKENHGL